MFALLILLPLAFAALALVIPWYQGRSWLLPAAGGAHLALAILLCSRRDPSAPVGIWVGLDALSVLVLLVTSVLFFFCSIYAVDYLRLRKESGQPGDGGVSADFFSAMTLAVTARHLGVSLVRGGGHHLCQRSDDLFQSQSPFH
jgi:hydrogenase-4 component F